MLLKRVRGGKWICTCCNCRLTCTDGKLVWQTLFIYLIVFKSNIGFSLTQNPSQADNIRFKSSDFRESPRNSICWLWIRVVQKQTSLIDPIAHVCLSHLAEVEPCVTNPCLHGGKCLPQGAGFSCYCPQGYAGENCEIGGSYTRVHTKRKHTGILKKSPHKLLWWPIGRSKVMLSLAEWEEME